jgi:hypothetical protein
MKKNRHTSGSLLADPAGLGPEITAKAIVLAFQTVVARKLDPIDQGVVSVMESSPTVPETPCRAMSC